MFFGRFFEVFKFNFVTKSDQVQNFKKHQITPIFAWSNIKREKYLKEIVFLNFFDIFYNKLGRRPQKFAAGVTEFWPCDEIRRLDGTVYSQSCEFLLEHSTLNVEKPERLYTL